MKFIRQNWATLLAIMQVVGGFLYPSLLTYEKSNPHTLEGVIIGTILAAFYDSRGKVKVTKP